MDAIKWNNASSEWESWAEGEVLRVPHDIPERALVLLGRSIRLREWDLDALRVDVREHELHVHGDGLLTAAWDELHSQITAAVRAAIDEAANDEARDEPRRASMLYTLQRLGAH
jgi:hypothetical protein